MAITMIGCSAPYWEAVSTRLSERALDAAEESGDVILVACDSKERWEILALQASKPDVVVIAVLPELVMDAYIEAFAVGASAAVYVDTSSAITADVIEAALHGEVLLPRQAVQTMAVLAKRLKPPSDLDESEIALLRALSAGRTIVDLANERFYSERTVRRHLQSLYLKLGVQNRAEAIAAATRMGIAD